MQHSFWNKRIPGLLVLVVMGLSFFPIVYLAGHNTSFFSRAAPSPQPLDVQVSNITDTSFTVSYRTGTSMQGSISYGKGQATESVLLDDRDADASNSAQMHTLHYFTVKNLTPQTQYSFVILSGGNTYQDTNKPYSVTTGATLDLPETSQTIQGQIVFPPGSPTEAIVIATSSGNQALSTLISSDGTYSFNGASIRTEDGSAYISSPESTTLSLHVVGQTQQASIDLPNALAQTVPPTTLGNSYDFSASIASESGSVASPSGSLPTVVLTQTPADYVSIVAPAEGQALTSQQPTFTGTAAPKTKVTITIHSADEISTSVTTDNLGNWHYTPSTTLAPGQHTITIAAVDANGQTQTQTQTFYVYASGSQFLVPSVIPPDATSTPTRAPATPTPTVKPTATPTPKPSPTPMPTAKPLATIAPTIIVSTPTFTPTSTPTLTPTPYVVTQTSLTPSPTSGSSLLAAGNNDALVSGIVGLIPVILGALLIYLSKGVVR